MTEPRPNVEEQPLLTRKAAVELLRSRGFPVSLDTFSRYPPRAIGKLGRNLLYEHKEVLAWPWRRMKLLPRTATQR